MTNPRPSLIEKHRPHGQLDEMESGPNWIHEIKHDGRDAAGDRPAMSAASKPDIEPTLPNDRI
jgi:hypothetical protein